MPTEDLEPYITAPFRLANRGTKATSGNLTLFLHRLGISDTKFDQWNGGWVIKKLLAENPTWTLRAWQVLILENLEILKSNND